MMVWMRNKFLAGLALALPLLVTFWILQFVYVLLHDWSEVLLGFVANLINELAGAEVIRPTDPNFIMVTRFVGFLIPILVLFALGVMATNVIGVRIVEAVDHLLARIPLISFIYKSLKQVIDAFKSLGGKQNFKRVVYIDYPMPGVRMIGFVTGQFCDPQTGKAMTSVFLPTAPSPMTGLLLIVDSERITDAPLSMEDSMKMIFSGGLVGPGNSAPPLNQKPPTTPPLPEADVGEDEEEEAVVVAEKKEKEEEMTLPFGLPRAEDFDSGDPDILASTSILNESMVRQRFSGKRLLKAAMPWRKRS